MDLSKIAVCHNLRIKQNKVFDGTVKRGKTSTGWFYGFKIHLMVSDAGESFAWQITLGNVDDRQPVPKTARHLRGKLFGDKSYISQTLRVIRSRKRPSDYECEKEYAEQIRQLFRQTAAQKKERSSKASTTN